MTKEEIKNNRVVRICYDYLEKFTDIYEESQPEKWSPENVKLTVYCKGTDEEGFLVNMNSDEMGLSALIAQNRCYRQ